MEFTTTRRSRLNQLLVMIIVVTLFEMPALQLALHGALAHLVVLALNILGIAWFLVDAWLMRRSAHRLDGALQIHLGLRTRGTVTLDNIAGARLISDGDRRGITPFDPPNVEIALRQPVTLKRYLGRRRYHNLRLFVDEPEALVAQLNR
jgi:hypothetical protein